MSTPIPADISLNGLNATRSEEGRALRAYQDSVGVWTIGYGLTNFDKNLPFKVGPGVTLTEDQAEWYLLKSLRENYVPACRDVLEGGTYAHPQGALDGAADFHFNTGGIKKATWPKALGRGDLAAAKQSMLSWNKAGGNVLSGLTRRRERNWGQVSAGDYGRVSGPAIIVTGANNREKISGTAALLTAFPPPPEDEKAGTVKTTGVPQATRPAPGVLQLGSTGAAVIELQEKLAEAGYATVATGVYDQQTYDSVLGFQHAHPSLTPDGKVGPATKQTILRAIQLRKNAAVVIKTATPAIPMAYITFHQFVSEHAGNIALGVGLAVAAAVIGFVVVKYRRDALAYMNSVIGRKVA